jgi:AbiV family abortive infection protein
MSIQRFAGPLGPDAAEAGILLLQANAQRLARDARLLFHAKRYPSAAMLAASALNELARIPLLMEIFAAGKDRRLDRRWQDFRQPGPGFPWAVFHPGKSKSEFAAMDDALAFIRAIGNAIECVGPGNWLDPERLIQPALVQELIAITEQLCAGPADKATLRAWIDTVRALPKDADGARMLDGFHTALKKERGLDNEAALLQELRKNQPDLR